MAATDKPFHNQYRLDIVFAVSSVLMLLSIVWMFWQDYNREYKEEQRRFRDVEVALAQRAALDLLPSQNELTAAEEKVQAERQKLEGRKTEIAELQGKLNELRPKREKAEARFQSVKADLESALSFINIEIEHSGGTQSPEVERLRARIQDLEQRAGVAQAERDDYALQMKALAGQIDAIERPLTEASSHLKKLNDRFDTQVKVAVNKRWGFGDWLRSQPIIDGFASPVKIHQITNNDIPIDYNFKHVTRFDRCTTCHLGIDRPAYTRANLKALAGAEGYGPKIEAAKSVLAKRREALEGMPDARQVPDVGALENVRTVELSSARITEYCAHPRLDLFVGSDSKHPVEKFGCSSCHEGQGSATSFTLASHTPNNSSERKRWVKEHDWESIHMWDFPMLPMRFVESGCLKCHHQVTDLVSTSNRNEAPKLLRGYNLIKEIGCFGCHEISALKGGQKIGPDLRLEPSTPLEALTPAERVRAEADTENPPGRMRKVGPSLYRLSEKTNRAFAAKWIRAPRSLRPDTKMPHFYGVSNNHPSVLPPSQKEFPDTEIWAVTEYLFEASDAYLKAVAEVSAPNAPTAAQDVRRLDDLRTKAKKGKLNANERAEMAHLQLRQKARAVKAVPLTDLAGDYKGDAVKGRVLFTERGCIACHSHEGTRTPSGKAGTDSFSPGVESEAVFGPNLSQLAAKLGKAPGDAKSARAWLVQWIVNPTLHSPRTRMPITHLTAQQAADVAAWLLSQPATDLGSDGGVPWADLAVKQPTEKQLKDLARVYLVRALSRSDMEQLLTKGTLEASIADDLPDEERDLVGNVTEKGLKRYLGRKAVSRLGCYACHDVPGFDNAKPIGVGLNDWGKKDPGRLAFEDILNFLEHHYFPVDSLTDTDGKAIGPKTEGGHTKYPYERFFYDRLKPHGQDRIGFLNQKLLDPRSYDHNREFRAWDDRYRMPQFHFARSRKRDGETDAQFEARAWKEEAEAREAVATFILGLVAEKLPAAVTSRPKGDRLAEVKGRQIIEKYNCNGCHLVRPGAYDFNVSPAALTGLEDAFDRAKRNSQDNGFHFFADHHYWVGKTPTDASHLLASALKPRLQDADEGGKLAVLRLTAALRFRAADGSYKDIPSATALAVPLPDFLPQAGTIKTQDEFDHALQAKAPLGGTFADLMTPYLAAKNPKLYTVNNGDSSQARASLPPPLLGQGERTQPDWLYQFLLDPQPVRRMSILRMPKFNLSPDEAQALVAYFAAVERQTNPGIGLEYPQVLLPQQGELATPYWKDRTAAYRAQLAAGNKGKTLLEEHAAAYRKIWEQIKEQEEGTLEKELTRAKEALTARTKERDDKKAQLEKEKDAGKKEALSKEIETLDAAAKQEQATVARLTTARGQLDVGSQEKSWQAERVYATDAYRLVVNNNTCLKCHQIGAYTAANPETQGPPLDLAHKRLRPDWVKRWVATPQRFLPYDSLMPVYLFSTKLVYRDVLPIGPKADPAEAGMAQVRAIRDVLMNYPRISELPENRRWNPYLQPAAPEEKKGGKESKEKK